MKQSSSKQVKVFLDKVSEMELFFVRFDEVIYASFQHGVSDPQQVKSRSSSVHVEVQMFYIPMSCDGWLYITFITQYVIHSLYGYDL